jgi:hypothetical protein
VAGCCEYGDEPAGSGVADIEYITENMSVSTRADP